MKMPAAIWPMLFVLLPLMVEFFQGEYFEGEEWVLLVVALLTMAYRFIEIYWARQAWRALEEPGGPAAYRGLVDADGKPAPAPEGAPRKSYLREAILG